jgi:hypothetical protein
MEPKGSLLHSQELSTCTYPWPDQSCPNHWSEKLITVLARGRNIHMILCTKSPLNMQYWKEIWDVIGSSIKEN